jgi:hypothetical protein
VLFSNLDVLERFNGFQRSFTDAFRLDVSVFDCVVGTLGSLIPGIIPVGSTRIFAVRQMSISSIRAPR